MVLQAGNVVKVLYEGPANGLHPWDDGGYGETMGSHPYGDVREEIHLM